MNKIKNWVIKNFAMKFVAKMFNKLEGKKTYVSVGLLFAIKFALSAGYIPADFIGLAEEIIVFLSGFATVSFGDKVKRNWNAAKEAGDAIVK